MEREVMELYDFFEKNIIKHTEKQKKLYEEDCKDEADFEKIKVNIYHIFKTILSVAIKQYDDLNQVYNFLLEKSEKFISDWNLAYMKAQEHNHIERLYIEKIKLDIVYGIKEYIIKIQRENK